LAGTGRYQVIGCAFDPEGIVMLDAVADALGLTRSEYMRRRISSAVKDDLEDLKMRAS
jgi:hypothetical protein